VSSVINATPVSTLTSQELMLNLEQLRCAVTDAYVVAHTGYDQPQILMSVRMLHLS